MSREPVSLTAAHAAVCAADLPELVALVSTFDLIRLDLAELSARLREGGQPQAATLIDVVTVRARQALLGFFDRAERSTPAPAPVIEPERSLRDIGESIAKKIAKKGGGK